MQTGHFGESIAEATELEEQCGSFTMLDSQEMNLWRKEVEQDVENMVYKANNAVKRNLVKQIRTTER